jgi:hypothetical protein
MTKTPIEEVEEYRDKSSAAQGVMTEAGGISFTTIYVDNMPFNVTSRSSNPYDSIVQLKLGIDLAKKFLGATVSKDLPQAAPPKATPVTDELDKVFPKEPVYEALTAEGCTISHATSIKILPQPDDKVSFEFYEDGKKYPVVKINKWKIENAQGLLASVTSQDVSKAAEVKVNCNVYWKQGNEFTMPDGKKGHYKNVELVEPA